MMEIDAVLATRALIWTLSTYADAPTRPLPDPTPVAMMLQVSGPSLS
jgi:hypothetical protein